MPARLIREDMLNSARVQKLPVEARWLFVSIMLVADDLGLFEADPYQLSRRAAVSEDVVGDMLTILADRDLIRLYSVEKKAFGFIPRFRQRLRVKRTRYALPPAALMADDSDALSKIKDLGPDLSDTCQAGDGHPLTNDGLNLNLNLNKRKDNTPPPAAPAVPPAPAGLFADAPAAPARQRKTKPAVPASVVITHGDLVAEGVDPGVAAAWLRVRSAKRAVLTDVAWAAVKREAGIAGMSVGEAVRLSAESGWQGFKAIWAATQRPTAPGPAQSTYLREKTDQAAAWMGRFRPQPAPAPDDARTIEMEDPSHD